MSNRFKVLLVTLALAFSTGIYAKGGGGGGGSHSFSSGSHSSSSGSKSFSSGSKSSSGSSGFSSGSKSSSGSSFSSGSSSSSKSSSGSKSSSSTYDKSASTAQTRSESSKSYSTYQNKQAAATIKSQPSTVYESRDSRQQTTFSNYYNRPQPTSAYIYHDSWNPYFWMWLQDQPSDRQAMWVYNHRSEMDDQRYQELKSKNAQLEQKVKELEQKGVVKDPTYAPPGIDHDLMYSDDYVKSVREEDDHSTFWIFLGLLTLVGVGFVIYAVNKQGD